MTDCVFCKIINKEFPSLTVYEDEKVICIIWRQSTDNSRIPLKYVVNTYPTDAEKPRYQDWSK